jgi:5-methylcytosine-specific restriction endonuclease McrA
MAKRKGGKKHRRRMARLFELYAGCCYYCGVAVRQNNGERPEVNEHATLDHLIPLSMGGTNEPGNIVLACRGCNLERGTMDATKFLMRFKPQEKAA